MTWPFALTAPSIIEALAPVTRLSVTALAFGWLKLTAAFLPTLKLSQLMTARCELWLMFICALVALELCVITAWPATTFPPVGNAFTAFCAWLAWVWQSAARPSSATTRRAVCVTFGVKLKEDSEERSDLSFKLFVKISNAICWKRCECAKNEI